MTWQQEQPAEGRRRVLRCCERPEALELSNRVLYRHRQAMGEASPPYRDEWSSCLCLSRHAWHSMSSISRAALYRVPAPGFGVRVARSEMGSSMPQYQSAKRTSVLEEQSLELKPGGARSKGFAKNGVS